SLLPRLAPPRSPRSRPSAADLWPPATPSFRPRPSRSPLSRRLELQESVWSRSGSSMLLLVGAVIVIASVLGGFMMHGGQPLVLNQPTEFIIIGGAALGSVVISTPVKVLKSLVGQLKGLSASAPGKDEYLDLLAMMYQLFRIIQQSGIMSLESHVEKPDESPILSKYPKFLGRHSSADFLSDSIKVMILGGISDFDLQRTM